MKKITILFILISPLLFAQSFEETNIAGVTTTSSATRSANFVDINNDGFDDIFFSNSLTNGQNNALYVNNGDGTFTTITTDDITLDNSRSEGVSFADVDNDGDVDAFVSTFGVGNSGRKNFFYRNNGDGTFTYEPNIAMGSILTLSEMATWVDVNNDQFLDLYITNSRGNLANLYYENQGDGSFQRITNLTITNENLKSRSIDWIDYDNDGDCDLFVTNEETTTTNGTLNSLFRNDGANNFTQITNLPFVQDIKSSVGSSWADIDNDGDFDLFIANANFNENNNQSNQLFINDNGSFIEQTGSIITSNQTGSSFGSSFGDMDNDGDLDLLVCNAYFSGQTKNFVYINDGNGNFTQDTTSSLANKVGYTYGCAFGDYDNDGWLDVILANTTSENQTNSLFHNTGSGNNWVKILCKGTNSNTSAIGAKVTVKAILNGNEVIQTRKIAASSGLCSQNSFTNHFGLLDTTNVDEITINWPSGLTETFTNLAINNYYVVVEGNGINVLSSNQVFLNSDIKIYPNPTAKKLKFEFNEPTLFQLIITNISGKIIFEINQKEIVTNYQLNLSKNIASGTYYIQITTDKGKTIHKKIIIK